MMTEDDRAARQLLDAKREIREPPLGTISHGSGGAGPAALAASTLFLSVLSDLKRVNSHLATIGYAVRSSVTPSHSDRLVCPPEGVE
jgi:phosphate:Na+ symporter